MKVAIYQFTSLIIAFALILVNYNNVHASPPASPAQAPTVYYVNPSGNDSNAGTSTASFKTLAKAVSVLTAGDTLRVSGTYNNQTLFISNSGTASAPISIIGENAYINANGTQNNGIRVSGNYINISGFDVKSSLEHGVLLSGKYITFENSSVHHGVLKNGSGGVCGTSNWASAVKVSLGGENIVIRGNIVYENCGEGIAITRGSNVLVENNTAYDNFAVNIYLDNSPYVTVQNNTITCTNNYLRNGTRAKGVAIGEEHYDGWGAQRHHNYILNNHIEGCSDGITSWEAEVSNGKLKDTVIYGNIIPSATRRGITILSINSNVLIENNSSFGGIYIMYPSGVTLNNNTTIQTTFADVSTLHWAYTWVEQLYDSGITSGCSTNPALYCPDSTVKRSEMAVFLLRGIYGKNYIPLTTNANIFLDVPLNYWAAAWIKAFAQEGITAGCGSEKYCPDGIVTRAQMSVFLLRSIHGSNYTPPPATGTMFADVPASVFAAAWIEQLAHEGISGGCGNGNYCPNAPVTRAQMAVFLVKTFDLP